MPLPFPIHLLNNIYQNLTGGKLGCRQTVLLGGNRTEVHRAVQTPIPQFLPAHEQGAETQSSSCAAMILAAEIASRRGAELFSEHGDKRTGTAVARVDSSSSHFLTGSEHLQPMKQPELLAPFAEGHFRFCNEQPLNRSFTRAAIFA